MLLLPLVSVIICGVLAWRARDAKKKAEYWKRWARGCEYNEWREDV